MREMRITRNFVGVAIEMGCADFANPSIGRVSILRRETHNNSARGSFVDVWAPGSSVYTTTTGSSYRAVSGTSFSCPIVAGLIALIWSARPNATPDEVERILKESAKDPINDFRSTYGLIDAEEAMFQATGDLPPSPAPTDPPPSPAPTPSLPVVSLF